MHLCMLIYIYIYQIYLFYLRLPAALCPGRKRTLNFAVASLMLRAFQIFFQSTISDESSYLQSRKSNAKFMQNF